MDWQKVKRDLVMAFSSHFFYKVVGYLVLMILTRYLTKEEMGGFFFAAALANFFVLFTELGTDSHVIREVAGNPERARRCFSEVISLRIPLFGLYFLALNGFALIFKPDLLLVIFLTSLYVFFDELYQGFGALFLGLKRVAYNVTAGVSTRLILVGLIFITVTLKKGLTEVLACYILANALLVVIAFAIFRRKIGSLKFTWDTDSARNILRVSLPFFILTLIGLVYYKVDSVMLGFMKPYSVVATYEAAYKLLEASRFIVRPMTMVFFPICSEMAARQDWSGIQTLLRKMLLVIGAMGGGMTLLVVTTAGFIIPTVFGPKYNDSITVLRILYLSVPLLYVSTVGGLLARSIFLERKTIKIMLICAITNIALNLMVIPIWSASGAACATVISEVILAFWLMRLNFQELRILGSKEPVSVLSKGLDHVG